MTIDNQTLSSQPSNAMGPATSDRPASQELLEVRLRPSKTRRKVRGQAAELTDQAADPADFHYLDKLFLCRESSEYDYLLLSKMIKQVLRPWERELDEVARAMEFGVMPIKAGPDGEKTREVLGVREIFIPSSMGSRRLLGVFFTIGRVGFFYALASAGQQEIDGENAFTNELRDLIKTLRPREIVTGPFSRMLRVTWIGAGLMKAMADYRVTLRCAESTEAIDLRSPSGRREWELLANAAQNDYVATLTRLLTGTTFEYKQGYWPRSELSLPIGYRKVGGKGEDRNKVIPDPTQKPVVRRLIELAASDATEDEIAVQLSELGVRSRFGAADEDRPLICDLKKPYGAVRTLFSHIPTYANGDYLVRHEMTIPYLDEFHGVAVNRESPEDNGYLEFRLHFELPEGGWHSPEMIEQAIEMRLRADRPEPPRWNRELIRPLAGVFEWTADGRQYVVHSSDQNYYTLRSRPEEERFTPDGKRRGFDDLEGRLDATFKAHNLHVAVARALRKMSGAYTDQPCRSIPLASTEDLNRLTTDLKQQLAAAERAIEGELQARTEDERNSYREKARVLHDTIAELRAQLATAQRQASPSEFSLLGADQLAAVAAELEATTNRNTTKLNSLLRKWLVRCTIDATAGYPIANVTINVAASTSEGPLRVGPLSHPVDNRALGENTGPSSSADTRNRKLIEILFLENATVEEREAAWTGEEFNARSFTRRIQTVLQSLPLTRHARSAILFCPILGVRRAVLAPLLGLDLDHDLDQQFADEVRRIYTSAGFTWSDAWCPGGMVFRRSVLDFVSSYADDPETGVDRKQIELAFDLGTAQLYDFFNDNSGKLSPRPAVLEDLGGWLNRGRSRHSGHPVGVKRCPHCGTRSLTQPLTVPEVPGGLLCVSCRQVPTASFVYPVDYLEPWDGPQHAKRLCSPESPDDDPFGPAGSSRVIVGTRKYNNLIPSIHAPQSTRKKRRKK